MIKELFATILLAIILVGAIINISVVNNLTGEISNLVAEAEVDAQNGYWDDAENKAETAADLWKSREMYTHIFLRHTEVDAATDAIYDLLKEVYSHDSDALKGAAQLATAHLESIGSAEKVTFGSIL